MPTSLTHQASASLRLRATPPATRVSRIERSDIRSRVMTGTLRVVKILVSSPHVAPQATFRLKWRSASRAILTRSSRVSSRNRSMRAARAAARASAVVPFASSTSGSVPRTSTSSPSALTSGGPTNHVLGSREANQELRSSGIDYIITSRHAERNSPPGCGLGRDFHRLGTEEVQDGKYDLGFVVLHAGRIRPDSRPQPSFRVQQAAFLQILAGELGPLPEYHEVVE